MSDQKRDVDEETKELHKKIRAWQRWLTCFAAALIVSYVVYFGVLLGQPPAFDADKWGAFGDFFGGILNPIVAFGAFYWLTQSVKLQKQELSETRLELKRTANAQAELVMHGERSVRVAALTALVNSVEMQIEIAKKELKETTGRIIAARAVEDPSVRELGRRQADFSSWLVELEVDRKKYYAELKSVVDASDSTSA